MAVTGLPRTSVYAHPERSLLADEEQRLSVLLKRRIDGEPMAYLTGEREFWSIPLKICPGVLTPRAETELLVETALRLAGTLPDGAIVDLGTGSGAIAIALASEASDQASDAAPFTGREIIAIDNDAQAIAMASHNIQVHCPGSVQLVRANWLDCIADQSVSLIIANPPYIASDDPHLHSLRYEPRTALVAGQHGLDDLSYIIRHGVRTAKPGALILLEHGNLQAEPVRSLLHEHGYTAITTLTDLAGLDRVSFGYRPK